MRNWTGKKGKNEKKKRIFEIISRLIDHTTRDVSFAYRNPGDKYAAMCITMNIETFSWKLWTENHVDQAQSKSSGPNNDKEVHLPDMFLWVSGFFIY